MLFCFAGLWLGCSCTTETDSEHKPNLNSTFTLRGANAGEQNNQIAPHSTHTYTVSLSHSLMYSLTVQSASSVSDQVTVYEGNNTQPLYIKAGPFTNTKFPKLIFSSIDNGSRYLVLPLVSTNHRVVLSNAHEQSQSYTFNLTEYTGTNSSSSRLLTAPSKMGFYDSTNGITSFWAHVPANKNIEVELDEYRGAGWAISMSMSGQTPIYSPNSTNTRLLSISKNEAQYTTLEIDNLVNIGYLQTNARFILHFVD